MEKIKVLLISTLPNIENKVELVKKTLKGKVKGEFCIYTNKEMKEIKNTKLNIFNVNKRELQNEALKNVDESVILLDLDYSEKTIIHVLENILENYKENDIINFEDKTSKFKTLFIHLLLNIYNYILSLFHVQPLLNINKNFQFLSNNVTKTMSNISKNPNFLRLFKNFSGYNNKTIDIEKEKTKEKTDIKFLLLAFFLLVLAIISIALTIFLGIKFQSSPNVSKMIVAEVIIFVSLIVCTFGSLTYHNYINSI